LEKDLERKKELLKRVGERKNKKKEEQYDLEMDEEEK
jgi:hypothetical protein